MAGDSEQSEFGLGGATWSPFPVPVTNLALESIRLKAHQQYGHSPSWRRWENVGVCLKACSTPSAPCAVTCTSPLYPELQVRLCSPLLLFEQIFGLAIQSETGQAWVPWPPILNSLGTRQGFLGDKISFGLHRDTTHGRRIRPPICPRQEKRS